MSELRTHGQRIYQEHYASNDKSRRRARGRHVIPAKLPVGLRVRIAKWLVDGVAGGAAASNRSDLVAVLNRGSMALDTDLLSAGLGVAPKNSGKLNLHRDASTGFSVLMPFTDVPECGGDLVFLTASEETEWHGTEDESRHVSRLLDKHEQLRPALRGGEAVFFNARLLHYGPRNVTSADRGLILNGTLGADSDVGEAYQQFDAAAPPRGRHRGVAPHFVSTLGRGKTLRGKPLGKTLKRRRKQYDKIRRLPPSQFKVVLTRTAEGVWAVKQPRFVVRLKRESGKGWFVQQ